jgi:hypothetical protein
LNQCCSLGCGKSFCNNICQEETFKNNRALFRGGQQSQATGWYGMFAPAGTPADIVGRLNKVIVAAVQSPEGKERLLAFALQPTGTSAAAFSAIQKAYGTLGSGGQGIGLHAGTIDWSMAWQAASESNAV